MVPCYSLFLCTLLLSFNLHGISAVNYTITNNAAQAKGGIRFTEKIGISATKKIMGTINNFIWYDLFQQNDPSDQKPVDVVNLYIERFIKGLEGITWGNNNINISSVFLRDYEGNVKWGFTSLLYHEMTHVFQWNGEGTTPVGLVEGIADYATLKAKYYGVGFAKPGDGDRWDQGYAVTARFLEYCDGITPQFVAKLNKMMRFAYNASYFDELTGKSVDQLWDE